MGSHSRHLLPSFPNPHPFFSSSLSPTPFDACYTGYKITAIGYLYLTLCIRSSYTLKPVKSVIMICTSQNHLVGSPRNPLYLGFLFTHEKCMYFQRTVFNVHYISINQPVRQCQFFSDNNTITRTQNCSLDALPLIVYLLPSGLQGMMTIWGFERSRNLIPSFGKSFCIIHLLQSEFDYYEKILIL